MNSNFMPITWDEVRDEFCKLNKELTHIIDEIKPTSAYTLYRVKYNYGSEYVKKGCLFIPDENGNLIPLKSPKIPKKIQDDLSYNLGSNPASFILNKSAELYMTLPNRSEPVPFAIIPSGRLFSTSVVLEDDHHLYQPAFLWSISAGAKTIFMLPKISKAQNYRRLQKKLGFNSSAPTNIFQHWNLFKEMQESGSNKEWQLEVIFFSKKWFDSLSSKIMMVFKLYMQTQLHKVYSFWNSQYVWNAYFSLINNLSGIRPNPYVYDTVKHILLLSMGIVPGIAPSNNDESAPINFIQKAFMDTYKIDYYLPIIMQPKYFDPFGKKSTPIYYSLHCPSAMELSPRSADNISTILELYEIKNLLQLYLRKLSSEELNISNTLLSKIPDIVEFDFFHSKPGNYRGIRPSIDLFNEDPSFSSLADGTTIETQQHPTISTIVRGCIRIKRKGK
jgi:hypothetical protein